MLLSLVACGGGKDEHEHTSVKVAAKAATCTEAGNNEYYTCSGCDKVFSDEACTKETTVAAQTIQATGHTWVDANCDTPKSCSACDATEGEALGHEWSGACDTSCNREGCDEAREASSHLDSNEDDVCDNCGEAISSQISGSGNGGSTGLPKDEFDN